MRVLLIVVVAALSTGCAASGAHPRPFPRPAGHPAAAPAEPRSPEATAPGSAGSAHPSGYALSGTALGLRGVPYRNGGAGPNGFDCSGFVWYVFAQHGLAMPRTVEEQYRVGGVVPPPDLRAGDLVFFSTTAPGASHVGIVIGGDSFIHAPSTSGVVRVERLGTPYWASRFIGARRVP
jgi:cell wall-associated NlpC family hydrolase